MFKRLCKPLKSKSFFLFGARATGKSTFLKEFLSGEKTHWVDLLKPLLEERYTTNPQIFYDEISNLKDKVDWVVVDEIQKCPKLLDLVHLLIEEKKIKFALTGSSARKLKRGAANLLAGRALMNSMFPLTHIELGEAFNLEEVLNWGSLPEIFSMNEVLERQEYLLTYAHAYLKEEIFAEQIVRNLLPFRLFLEVAAQSHGKQVNFRKIGRQLKIDGKTIQNYFQVLEDTLVGFFLFPFHSSLRKSIQQIPKFLFFDLGVQRALAKTLESKVVEKTSAFGDAFESFVILEISRLNSYHRLGYQMNYFSDGKNEIDLILTKGNVAFIAIEIKSTTCAIDEEIEKFDKLATSIKAKQKIFISRDPLSRKTKSGVQCLNWPQALKGLRDDAFAS